MSSLIPKPTEPRSTASIIRPGALAPTDSSNKGSSHSHPSTNLVLLDFKLLPASKCNYSSMVPPAPVSWSCLSPELVTANRKRPTLLLLKSVSSVQVHCVNHNWKRAQTSLLSFLNPYHLASPNSRLALNVDCHPKDLESQVS